MDGAKPSSQGFTGTVNLQLTDLIQMVCLSRSDLLIQVRSSEGSGSIHVIKGQVCHAETERFRGEDALFLMLGWEDGRFEMFPSKEVRQGSINKPWEHLLVEAMRRRDERKEGEGEKSDQCEENIDRVFDELEEQARPPTDMDLSEEDGTQSRVRVLVVDDSLFFARQLKRLFEVDDSFEIVGMAKNGKDALEFLASHSQVDLITLDIRMPVMPGDTTLKHIMIRRPIPVLMLSSFEPESIPEIFDFLQLGAVDFISKPSADEDLEDYGRRLRGLAQRVSKGDVSRFRRWRRHQGDAGNGVVSPRSNRRVLAIVGAEGAYLDWLRFPLPAMCRQGIVLGIQELSDAFLRQFCRLVEKESGAGTVPILESGPLKPGVFHLGNARQELKILKANDPPTGVRWDLRPLEKGREWHDRVGQWLEELAGETGEALSLCFLSGARAVPPEKIRKLLDLGARFILPPEDSVLCPQLIRSVAAVGSQEKQVVRERPENLMEVWLNDANSR